MSRFILLLVLLVPSFVNAAEFNFVRCEGKYYVIAKVNGKPAFKEVSVAILELDNVPVVPIDPDPINPTIPEGWKGLTKVIYSLAIVVPKASRTKAKDFGDNFEAVAAGLAAGQFATINAANAELKAKNEATVGTDRDIWVPVLTNEAKSMQLLFSAGAFTGLPDYADAYHAIAEGFHLAAKAN